MKTDFIKKKIKNTNEAHEKNGEACCEPESNSEKSPLNYENSQMKSLARIEYWQLNGEADGILRCY